MKIKDQIALYPCTDDEKREIRKQFGLKPEIIDEHIDDIMEWYNKQPHLANSPIDRDIVEKLFMAAKCSREKAKRKIDILYKNRSLATEILDSRKKILMEPDTEIWTFYRQAAMRKLYNGKRISVFKIMDPNPNSFINEEVFGNTIMLGDLRLKYDYMLGDIWIFDLQNVKIGHILRINLTLLQKFVNIIQDGIGFKLFEVHVVNSTTSTQQVFNLFKRFVKPKIFDRFVFHENFDELKKFIPVTCLPKDYGGEEPSLEEYKEMYSQELRKDSTRDYLISCCDHVSNEKLRPGDFNEDYLPGSFSKLEVD